MTHPDMADRFARMLGGVLPDDWETTLPVFMPESGEMATRDAGGVAMNSLAAVLANLVGGSADLDPSTRTVLKGCGDFESPRAQSPDGRVTQGTAGGLWGYAGRNIHFGLREHAMAAVMTGMACHGGVLPFGATFLSFSDYMRPSIRLAALSRVHVILHLDPRQHCAGRRRSDPPACRATRDPPRDAEHDGFAAERRHRDG